MAGDEWSLEFGTQRQILEYLWKNVNDRSLVQRMISRKEILRGDWVYILNDKDKKIEELEVEIKKLRSEITTIKESNWDLDEAKAQWEYWEWQARGYAQYCSDVIDVCYKKIKSIMWGRFTEDKETFKEWIQRAVKGDGE